MDTEKEGLTESMSMRNVKYVNLLKYFTYILRMRHANEEQLQLLYHLWTTLRLGVTNTDYSVKDEL